MPECIPPGTVALHLGCTTKFQRCAVFPDDRAAEFSAAGYTHTFPGMGSSVLGLAYPVRNSDPDNDQVPSAMEYLMGTDPLHPDSDRDGVPDGVEAPFAGLWLSDPCDGSNVQCPRPEWWVFEDSFE